MSTATRTAADVRVNAWNRRPVYMSTTRAASILGYTSERIRQMCVSGEVEGAYQVREGGKWKVPLEWVNSRKPAPVLRRDTRGANGRKDA